MITNVAAIHHAKILRLFGRYVERLEQAFREDIKKRTKLKAPGSALALLAEKAYR